MANIQASGYPILLRATGTTPWLTLICLKNYNVPVQMATNESDTFCGKAVGIGNASFNPQGNAVIDSAPISTEITYTQLLTWELAKTAIEFKVAVPSVAGTLGSIGAEAYLSGECYVVSTNIVFQTNDVINFDFELKGFGTLDITA